MIVVILDGRLGHQLHSYAAGLALARHQNSEVAVYKKNVKYYYLNELGIFPKTAEEISRIDLKENRNELLQYNPNFFNNSNCVIQGAWQHPQYTDQVVPELKEKIQTVPNEYTSIHVRRGDFLQVRKNVVINNDYIEAAKKYVPGPYCVVSDDIEWCKKNIVADVYKSDRPVDDFKFLAGSKNLILSASSFSWWAGRLSKGKVVAPKNWVPENWRWKTEHHICPDKWKLL